MRQIVNSFHNVNKMINDYENNNNNDNAKVPNNDDTKYQNSQSKSATYQNNFINVLSSIKKKKPIYKLTP